MSRRRRPPDPLRDLENEVYEDLQRAWVRELALLTLELTTRFDRKFPGEWGIAFRHGDAHHLLDRPAEAEETLVSALARARLPWEEALTAEWLGRIRALAEDRPAAERRFRHAAAVGTTRARHAFAVAEFLWADGRRDEAESILEEAVGRATELRECGLAGLGLIRRAQRRYREAERLFLDAHEVDAESVLARRMAVDVEQARRVGDLTAAERRTRLGSVDPDALPATARELADGVARDTGESRETERIRALALWELGLYPEARSEFSRRRERGLGDRLYFSFVGRIFEAEFQLERAEEAFRKAAEAEPGHSHPLIGLAGLRLWSGRLAEAEAFAREATRKTEGAVDEAWHHVGLAVRGLGRYEEARDAFRRAVEIDPDYELARTCLEDLEETLRRFPHLRDPAAVAPPRTELEIEAEPGGRGTR